jgi:hypothetical protein
VHDRKQLLLRLAAVGRDAIRREVDEHDRERARALGERWVVPGPVRLPLVVEDLIAEIEIDGPVVDEIRPCSNLLTDLRKRRSIT